MQNTSFPIHRQSPLTPPILRDGALDLLKLFAALSMFVDHFSDIILGGTDINLMLIGRLAFPLFCYITACHIVSGKKAAPYAATLLLLAIPTQPFYSAAFGGNGISVLVTLAAGALLAEKLLQMSPVNRHLLLVAMFAGGFWQSWSVRYGLQSVLTDGTPMPLTGFEYGLLGVMFPAILTLLLSGDRLAVFWTLLLAISVNLGMPYWDKIWWWQIMAMVGMVIMVFAPTAILFCDSFRALPRFLPNWFMRGFYPGHLIALLLFKHLS